MPNQITRGYIEVTEGSLQGTADGIVKFMFNPTQYVIAKSVSISRSATPTKNVPRFTFTGGQPRSLTVELFFDSLLPREDLEVEDLRGLTNKLFNFMMVDESLQGKNSKAGLPPKCLLYWGKDTKNHFTCYITSCSITYTMFHPQSGLPVRAKANLTLMEAVDKEERLPTNPTSLGEPGRRVWIVSEGDRLDWIAYREYGDPTEWRHLALANNISNPLDLRPGMVLAIPPRG